VLKRSRIRALGTLLLLALPACGGGVITSEDVSPGEAVVIGLIVIAAALYVVFMGTRGD
jgi:hypothetical protein